MRMRVGNGFDVHRFSDDPTRPLVLGGVTFEGEIGLHGHSDADVLTHCVAEALLGAAGLGDLGSHFPDTDERFAGAVSTDLLAEVVSLVAADGWSVANVDCSVIAERPKLAPARSAMQESLSALVGAPVTVKGRRAEGIGGLGRAEGIACFASALLVGDDGASRDGVPGEGAPAASAPGDGAPGEGDPAAGAHDDGAPELGDPGDSAPRQAATDEGTPPAGTGGPS